MSDHGGEINPWAIPGITGNGPRVYVIGYRNETVKVGFTEQPKIRLASLQTEARSQSNSVERIWLSVPHDRARKSERELIDFCSTEGRRPGAAKAGEYFTGLRFDDVVAAAEETVAERMAEQAEAATKPKMPWETYVPDEAEIWLDKHPLTCGSLMGQVLRGELALIDVRTGDLVDPRTAHDWSRFSEVFNAKVAEALREQTQPGGAA